MESFVDWCKQNNLQLNTNKTKGMVIDFRRSKHAVSPIRINGKEIQTVTSYKYLGVHLDNKLSWATNIDLKKDRVVSIS